MPSRKDAQVLPIRDDNPVTRTPWVTWLLIAANVAVFGYEAWLLYGVGPREFDAFVNAFAFVPSRFFAAPFSPVQWFTVFSAMFMHAGWLHIGGNMLYLWIFGNNIEDRLGPGRFLGFYLLCGVVATMAQAFVAPGAGIPNLGASGAIAGVLGAYLLLFPRARVLIGIIIFIIIEMAWVPAWIVIGLWFLLQLGSGLGSLTQSASGGVAYFAHVGGFVTGVLLVLPVWAADRKRPTRFAGYR